MKILEAGYFSWACRKHRLYKILHAVFPVIHFCWGFCGWDELQVLRKQWGNTWESISQSQLILFDYLAHLDPSFTFRNMFFVYWPQFKQEKLRRPRAFRMVISASWFAGFKGFPVDYWGLTWVQKKKLISQRDTAENRWDSSSLQRKNPWFSFRDFSKLIVCH